MGILYTINQQSTEKNVKTAAGMELIGCANITTGIINPENLESALNGNGTAVSELSETIDWTISKKSIFERHYVLHTDGSMFIPDQNTNASSGEEYPHNEAILQSVLETGEAQYTDLYQAGDQVVMTGYAPIYEDHDPSKEIIAINAIDFEESIITERTWEMMKPTVLALIFLPFLTGLFAFIFVKKVINPRLIQPVADMNERVHKVANGDFTVEQVKVKSNDEMGQLSNNFHAMIEKLRETLENVRKHTDEVSSTSRDVTVHTEESKQVNTEMETAIQEIAAGTQSQTGKLTSSTQTTTKISNEMNEMESTIMVINDKAKHATDIANQGEEVISKSVTYMNQVGNQASEMANVVGSLNNRSSEIGRIISMIQDVTDQTNLLALNASIEAARAGEHGKGFAVVAEEVRKLAEQSGQAASEIDQLIHEVQNETAQAVQVMETTEEVIKDGVSSVKEAGNSFEQIHQSVGEVEKQLNDMTDWVKGINQEVQSVTDAFAEINIISETTDSQTQEMASATEQQSASTEEIYQSMKKLSSMTEELKQIINYFQLK